MHQPHNLLFPTLVRFLYTHNPFYLLGTLLVLVGVQQCLGREPSVATSGLLVGLLAGYTLLLAGVAAIVIRVGQVWDDARTILLVIVLLLFMLSTSLDFHLLFTLEEPWPGTLLLAGGFLFSVALSEALLRGLKIGLSAMYRGPYYLVLLLLFAYPIALGWLNYYSYYQSLTWALFAFPAIAAAALLTLLPAAQMPAWRDPKSGTPWPWPFYPWSLFIFLTVGLAIRAWWLTIAFEPAKGADAYFRPYFLLPLAFVWAALVLEMGLARRSRGAVMAGLLMPLIGLMIGFPGPGQNAVEVAFLDRLMAGIASPPQLAVAGMLLFYAYAWSRGIAAAEGLALATALLASVVGRQTLDWHSLAPPNLLLVAGVAGTLMGLALHRQSTWRALAGGALVTAGLFLGGPQVGDDTFWFWRWHAPPLAAIAIAAVFDDHLARELRKLAWRILPCLALVAAIAYPWAMPRLLPSTLAAYLAATLVLAGALWLRQRHVQLLAGAIACLAANILAQTRAAYVMLEQTTLAGGLPWLALGGLIVVAAFLISLLKMGVWHDAWRWLVQVNTRLGGPESATG